MLKRQYWSRCEDCDCTFFTGATDLKTAIADAEDSGWLAKYAPAYGGYMMTCKFCVANPDATECDGCK